MLEHPRDPAQGQREGLGAAVYDVACHRPVSDAAEREHQPDERALVEQWRRSQALQKPLVRRPRPVVEPDVIEPLRAVHAGRRDEESPSAYTERIEVALGTGAGCVCDDRRHEWLVLGGSAKLRRTLNGSTSPRDASSSFGLTPSHSIASGVRPHAAACILELPILEMANDLRADAQFGGLSLHVVSLPQRLLIGAHAQRRRDLLIRPPATRPAVAAVFAHPRHRARHRDDDHTAAGELTGA